MTDPFKVDGPTIISTSGKVGASVTLEDQWLLNRLLGPLHVAPGPSDFRATVELVPVSRWGASRRDQHPNREGERMTHYITANEYRTVGERRFIIGRKKPKWDAELKDFEYGSGTVELYQSELVLMFGSGFPLPQGNEFVKLDVRVTPSR